MFELDFSIRDVCTREKVIPTDFQSECETTKRKHDTPTKDDTGVEDNTQGVDTPEHIKRLRLDINEAFENDDMFVDEDAFNLLCLPDSNDERPRTPPELLALREVIGSECVDGTTITQEEIVEPPERLEDPFKHAGLFREYGGIAGWMKLYGRKKETRQDHSSLSV